MTAGRSCEVARQGPLRVVLVDDHTMVREGLACLLGGNGGLEVVGEAGNGVDALEVVGRTHPDIVLMDVSMPRMGGIEATRRIVSRWPEIKVVGLSMETGAGMRKAMLSAGASSFLDKSDEHGSLGPALEALCRTEPATDGDIRLIHGFSVNHAPPRTSRGRKGTLGLAQPEFTGGSFRSRTSSTPSVRSVVPQPRPFGNCQPAEQDILGRMPQGLRILLVENHPDVVRVFTLMLASRGHAVTSTASIEGAKSAFALADFDLLLCDYRVDDGTATDLITWLRATGSRLKSICVSGYGNELAKGCRHAGFDGFLTKPVDVEVLESLVASLGTEAAEPR